MRARSIAVFLHQGVEDYGRWMGTVTVDIVLVPLPGRTVDENQIRRELLRLPINKAHDPNFNRTSVTRPDEGMALAQAGPRHGPRIEEPFQGLDFRGAQHELDICCGAAPQPLLGDPAPFSRSREA